MESAALQSHTSACSCTVWEPGPTDAGSLERLLLAEVRVAGVTRHVKRAWDHFRSVHKDADMSSCASGRNAKSAESEIQQRRERPSNLHLDNGVGQVSPRRLRRVRPRARLADDRWDTLLAKVVDPPSAKATCAAKGPSASEHATALHRDACFVMARPLEHSVNPG